MSATLGTIIENLPEIIAEGAKSPLALMALAICVLAIVAVIFFRREGWKVKVPIFLVIAASLVAAVWASYHEWEDQPIPPPPPATRVLVIDSHARRYNRASDLTNAHEIRRIFTQLDQAEHLGIVVSHLLVTSNFDEHDTILAWSPDLVVMHLSSFYAVETRTIEPVRFEQSMTEFRGFVTYLFRNRPGIKVLVYSRQPQRATFRDRRIQALVAGNIEEQRRFLTGFGERARLVVLPSDARFDQPAVVLAMKDALREMLRSRR